MHPNRRRAILPLTALACLVGSLLQSACLGTGRCDTLRADLLHKRELWASCDPGGGDDQCVMVGGDESDCTGVLHCAFPVNRANRGIAEEAVIQNASESPLCAAVCSTPTCGDTESVKPYCDATLRRCVIDATYDGGSNAPPIEEPDATPPTQPHDAGVKDALGE